MNENEQEQIKTLPWFGIPKLIPYVKPYRRKIILMVSLGILSSVADAVFPLFNRYALDHFVAEKTLQGLGFFCVLFVVLLVLQSIDNYISTYLGGQVEMGIDRDLRNAAFNHLQTLSFSYFNQNNVGYIHARVMSDAQEDPASGCSFRQGPGQMKKRCSGRSMQDFRILQIKINSGPQSLCQRLTGRVKAGKRLGGAFSF